MHRNYLARRMFLLRRRQQGAVAILVGLSITAMIGFAGLALDLGKLYVVKTELQNSADACALAASQALTGANNQQLAIGEAAGITTGLRHKVLFQKDTVTLTPNSTVEFSADGAADSFVSKAGLSNSQALAMRFVRCTVNKPNIDTSFIQVLNVLPGVQIGQQNVVASAVATLQASQISCGLPVAVCSSDLPASTPVGTWLVGAFGSGNNQSLTGSFKWVDFSPPNGGASELGALLTGDGACNLPAVGSAVGQPGAITSLANEWNSRFGIYQGNVRPDSAAPDQSGFAYTDFATSWPSKFNAFEDFVAKRGVNAAYQGDTATGLNTKGTIKDASYLNANGHDRRLMTAPVVNCGTFATSQVAPIISWACVFLLHPINNSAGGANATGESRMYIEYRGSADNPSSPCASNGLPGGAGSTGPLVAALVR